MATDLFAMGRAEAVRQGVDPELVTRVIRAESGGRVDAVSPKGARGPMQLMPATAAGLGVNPDDPADNIRGGVTYLRQMRDQFGGDPALMLAAYNAGPGNVKKHGGVPPFPETQNYIQKILGEGAGTRVAQAGGKWDSDALFGVSDDAPAEQGKGQGGWDSDAIFGAPPEQAQTQAYTPSVTDLANEPPPQASAAPSDGFSMGGVVDAAISGGKKFVGGVVDAADAAQHNAREFVSGIPSHALQGVASVANAVAPDSEFAAHAADTANAVRQGNAKLEADYQARVPDGVPKAVGATVGMLAPAMLGPVGGALSEGGALVGNAVRYGMGAIPGIRAAAPIAGRMASGATQGAALGAASPAAPSGDYWENVQDNVKLGALIGGAVPAVTGTVGGVVSGARDLAAPILEPGRHVAKQLGKMLGDEAPTIAQRLAAPVELVPGSLPTASQIAGNTNLVQIEKALANNPAYKGRFVDREVQNNSARLAELRDVAKTPDELAAAVNARRAATAPDIEALVRNGKPVDVTPVLGALEQLQNSGLGTNPTVRAAAGDLAAQIRAHAGDSGAVSADIMDGLRQNTLKFIQKNAPNGVVGSRENAALGPIQDAITDAIETANPGYRRYLGKYAEASAPISSMETAQGIMDNLGGRALNAGGDPALTLAGLQAQLRQAGRQTYGLTPEASARISAVADDLQRATTSNSIRVPGSDTAYNLQAPGWLGRQIYGDQFSGAGGLAKLLAAGAGFAGGGPGGAAGAYVAANSIGNAASKKVNDELARLLLDPRAMSAALSPAGSNSKLSQILSGPIGQAISRASPMVAPVIATRQGH